tara:strand:- start:14026 stop:14223 length:198 start_codon:yes stop_codon:yes gene_type:complete
MENFTKKDLLNILNIYQGYNNDFTEITEHMVDTIYFEIAKEDVKNNDWTAGITEYIEKQMKIKCE